MCLTELNRNNEAIECWNAAIRHDPKHAPNYFSFGILLNKLGQKLEAIECWDAGLKLNSDASVFTSKGNALNDLERKIEAMECWDQAIKTDPEYAPAYNNKANALNDLGKRLEAIESYNIAIRIQPDNPNFYFNKGHTLIDLGRNEEAIQCFNNALALGLEENTDFHIHKGIALSNLWKMREAIQSYDAALKIEPFNCAAINHKGNALYALGKKLEAIQCYNKAIRENSDFADAYINKGDTLSSLRRMLEAIQCYDEVIQIKPDYSEAYGKKGQVFDDLGRRHEAIECYNTAIRLNPYYAVNRDEIESNALGINSEIQNNPRLKSYYEALYNRLLGALLEAESICYGENIEISDENEKAFALSKAIELIPLVGSLLSSTSGVDKTICENNIIKNAIKIQNVIGPYPTERENVMQKAAEIVTLNNKQKIDIIETNLEVEYWISKGFVAKCKDFFTVDCILYQSKPQILGCIDALKIIYAIQNDQIKQNPSSDLTVYQIALVISSHKFYQGETVNENPQKKVSCKIFFVNEIEYRNPLLNNLELLKKVNDAIGFPIYKIIDYTNMLIELGYNIDKLDVETLCCLMISLA